MSILLIVSARGRNLSYHILEETKHTIIIGYLKIDISKENVITNDKCHVYSCSVFDYVDDQYWIFSEMISNLFMKI